MLEIHAPSAQASRCILCSCVSHDDTGCAWHWEKYGARASPKVAWTKSLPEFWSRKKNLKIKQGNKGPFLDAHGLYSGPQGFEEILTKILQNNFITTYQLGPPGMGICLELRWIEPWTWDIVYCPMKPNQHHVNCFIMQHHLAISFHIINHRNDPQCMFQIVSALSATSYNIASSLFKLFDAAFANIMHSLSHN